jgi:hypothetical protein
MLPIAPGQLNTVAQHYSLAKVKKKLLAFSAYLCGFCSVFATMKLREPS